MFVVLVRFVGCRIAWNIAEHCASSTAGVVANETPQRGASLALIGDRAPSDLAPHVNGPQIEHRERPPTVASLHRDTCAA